MVMSILACAAPAVNNIRPAIATRKERILPLASRPSLRRLDCNAALTVPHQYAPNSALVPAVRRSIVNVWQGANKAEAGLNAAGRAIFREAPPCRAVLDLPQTRNLLAVSALQVSAAPVGCGRAPRNSDDEGQDSAAAGRVARKTLSCGRGHCAGMARDSPYRARPGHRARRAGRFLRGQPGRRPDRWCGRRRGRSRCRRRDGGREGRVRHLGPRLSLPRLLRPPRSLPLLSIVFVCNVIPGRALARASDVKLHIEETQDSGFGASRRPGMTF